MSEPLSRNLPGTSTPDANSQEIPRDRLKTTLGHAIEHARIAQRHVAVLVLAMPVLGICCVVALIEGLVRRDLRRWGGGRESGFIYHWAKRVALPIAVGVWLIYLMVPVSIHPSFVILPFAALLGLATSAAASTFKKYL